MGYLKIIIYGLIILIALIAFLKKLGDARANRGYY